VVGAEPAQLALAVVDFAIEVIDQAPARLQVARPGLGQQQACEQLAAADAEQVGDGARFAVCEQDRVHALLQARAVVDEMETPARPLPLCAHVRVGQPDRRHQLTTRQLG
jgi:hypothetical protein